MKKVLRRIPRPRIPVALSIALASVMLAGLLPAAAAPAESPTPAPAETFILREVRFHRNGGRGTMRSQRFAPGESLKRNAFTRPGWRFAGWSDNPIGRVRWANGAAMPRRWGRYTSRTLYAVWTPRRPPRVRNVRVTHSRNGSRVRFDRIGHVSGYEMRHARNRNMRNAVRVPLVRNGRSAGTTLYPFPFALDGVWVQVRAVRVDTRGRRDAGNGRWSAPVWVPRSGRWNVANRLPMSGESWRVIHQNPRINTRVCLVAQNANAGGVGGNFTIDGQMVRVG